MERLTNIGSSGEIWITDNDETRRYGRKETAYKKLAEYEDLEEQGLLLRLPCKVGDTIWDAFKECITECKVDHFAFDEDEPYMIIVAKDGSFRAKHYFINIGKNVYLTREEAKQKLKTNGE